MTRRESINIDQACRLYDRLKTWPAVARVMRRRDGSKFQAQSIVRAVRTQDRSAVSSQTLGGARE